MMGFGFNMTPRLSFIALVLILVLQVLIFLIGFKLGGVMALESGIPKGRFVMPAGGLIPRSSHVGGSESSGAGVANHSPSEVGSSGGQINFPKKQN
jgi:hypothetical protein